MSSGAFSKRSHQIVPGPKLVKRFRNSSKNNSKPGMNMGNQAKLKQATKVPLRVNPTRVYRIYKGGYGQPGKT